MVGVIVTLLSLFFTHLQVHHLGITLLVVVLTATIFSLLGFINAVFARNFDDISIIPTFVLTPLTYLGGVFYSITLLPPFWQTVSLANPVLHMVNAFRYGILGVSDIKISVAMKNSGRLALWTAVRISATPTASSTAPNRRTLSAGRLRRLKIITAPLSVNTAASPPPIRFEVDPVAARTSEGARDR